MVWHTVLTGINELWCKGAEWIRLPEALVFSAVHALMLWATTANIFYNPLQHKRSKAVKVV
jgi:hypothetical protein